ncbi:hypothetical protein ACG0Z6_00750 [Roseateles sp. BYS180W]|uniref:Uncharacterized protein n=1 Tax=Roseateles rivi TaxID=3299028 RepID=A0ABW7FR52_9BURK
MKKATACAVAFYLGFADAKAVLYSPAAARSIAALWSSFTSAARL